MSKCSKIFPFVFIVFVLVGGCKEPIPEFVAELIASDDPRQTDAPEEVWRYRFEGKIVYYIPPQCCDIPSTLYDQNGARICSPDGGLTGSGDGACPTFFQDRESGVLIWKKKRE